MAALAFSERGERLWASLIAQDETLDDELNPLREVAVSACRTADRVEELERIAVESDPIVDKNGMPVMHPVHAEVRQQAASLARLITALRLPDEATGKRPQHRGTRGAQKPSQIGTARVSSIERARARAAGGS
jgi:hypothetical protein